MIISNNLIGKMPIADNAIIRINLAWIKSLDEAKRIITNSKHDIYLDYPTGRTKPPRPVITLNEAIELTKNKQVKYFAISNAEDISKIKEIKSKVKAELVPKIETQLGVSKINEMIEAGIKTIMLDKEDLYIDANCDSKEFNLLVNSVRSYKDRVKILELQGVIFI